ncbi:MAG: aa3-type cytochrome c oxidase subunit IV [Sphingomonas sp.]
MVSSADAEREVRTHRDTYGLFTGLMKWGTILSFVAAMIVVFIIAN